MVEDGEIMIHLDKQRESYYRVTEVLCPFNGYGAAPASLMKQYQRRGTIVHKACNRFTEIGPDWYLDLEIDGMAASDEEISLAKPYVDSFAQWFDPSTMQIIEKEERLYDDSLELTGEPDLIISQGGCLYIDDIKTSKSVNKTWAFQLAAYRYLMKNRCIGNLYPYKRRVIQVSGEGIRPNVIVFDDYETEIDIFLKAVELYKTFCPRKKVIYEEGE